MELQIGSRDGKSSGLGFPGECYAVKEVRPDGDGWLWWGFFRVLRCPSVVEFLIKKCSHGKPRKRESVITSDESD